MNDQQNFINTLIAELDDIKFDIEMDLGPDSVPYEKIKTLMDTVYDYQESLN
jgi:hypothetical protein